MNTELKWMSKSTTKTLLHLNRQRECPPIDSYIFRPPRQFGRRNIENKSIWYSQTLWLKTWLFSSQRYRLFQLWPDPSGSGTFSDPAIFPPKLPIFTNIGLQQNPSCLGTTVCLRKKKSTFFLWQLIYVDRVKWYTIPGALLNFCVCGCVGESL